MGITLGGWILLLQRRLLTVEFKVNALEKKAEASEDKMDELIHKVDDMNNSLIEIKTMLKAKGIMNGGGSSHTHYGPG